MNLSKQIKYYRKRDDLSQEELAERIYVSRQSISNWENERSYPDIHNILMMGVLFDVSLDQLVKGDVEKMKAELQRSTLYKWSFVMLAFIIAVPLSVAPVMYFFGDYGLILSFILFIVGLYASIRIERIKKKHHIKTYRQIMAFLDGKPIDEMEPNGKDWLVKVVIVLACALFSFVLVYLSMSLLGI